MKKIVIIGGGVAGITAAIKAKNSNTEVIVLEKNDSVLKKLLITGNGKCNYFNDDFNASHYYSQDINLIPSIINEASKNILLEFFDFLGIIPRIKNGYYYPYSNQAYTMYNALMKEIELRKIKIETNTNVLDIKSENDKFIIVTNKSKFIADKVILSAGSKAYPKTGSTGDSYKFSDKLNICVNPVYPGLVQLVSNNKNTKQLSGIRTDVKVTLLKDNKLLKTDIGEVQFTDYGLSGICIYNLSNLVNYNLDGMLEVSINFFYEFANNKKEIIDLLNERFNKVPGRTITEILEEYLNYKIVNNILKNCKLDMNSLWHKLNQNQKEKLVSNLIDYRFQIIETKDYTTSQVCVGGVSLKEIDLNSFNCLKDKNLYLVGELLDITGDCGGYNLSLAFLSGIKAGISAGEL